MKMWRQMNLPTLDAFDFSFSVIYNERMRLYVLVDVRGITTWRPQAIEDSGKLDDVLIL